MTFKDQLATLLQRLESQRGFVSQLIQKLYEHVDELGNRITRHGEDHALLIETITDRLREVLLLTQKEAKVSEKVSALQRRQKALVGQLSVIMASLPQLKVVVTPRDRQAAEELTYPAEIGSLTPEKAADAARFEALFDRLEPIVNLFQLTVAQMKTTLAEQGEYQKQMATMIELFEEEFKKSGRLPKKAP